MLVKFVAKFHKPRILCFAATLIADSHLQPKDSASPSKEAELIRSSKSSYSCLSKQETDAFYHEISLNSCFKAKTQRNSALSSTELLLKKPQVVPRTFAWNFDESSQE